MPAQNSNVRDLVPTLALYDGMPLNASSERYLIEDPLISKDMQARYFDKCAFSASGWRNGWWEGMTCVPLTHILQPIVKLGEGDRIVLHKSLRDELKPVVDLFKDPHHDARLRIIQNRTRISGVSKQKTPSLLLVGHPGTGKTSTAQELARIGNLNALEVKYQHAAGMNQAETLRAALEVIIEMTTGTILFIDEIDTIAPSREVKGEGAGSQSNTLVENARALLGLLEHPKLLENRIVFVAATNVLKNVDKGVRDRFTRILSYDIQLSYGVRSEYLATHFRFSTKNLAKLTVMSSGLDFRQLEALVSFCERKAFEPTEQEVRALDDLAPGAGMEGAEQQTRRILDRYTNSEKEERILAIATETLFAETTVWVAFRKTLVWVHSHLATPLWAFEAADSLFPWIASILASDVCRGIQWGIGWKLSSLIQDAILKAFE